MTILNSFNIGKSSKASMSSRSCSLFSVFRKSFQASVLNLSFCWSSSTVTWLVTVMEVFKSFVSCLYLQDSHLIISCVLWLSIPVFWNQLCKWSVCWQERYQRTILFPSDEVAGQGWLLHWVKELWKLQLLMKLCKAVYCWNYWPEATWFCSVLQSSVLSCVGHA